MSSELEVIVYFERADPLRRDPHPSFEGPRTAYAAGDRRAERRFECPSRGYDGRLRTCKRRGCPRCGSPWARDWQRGMAVNLAAKHGPVVLVSITAPGEDLLPWDLDHCAGKHRDRKPKHSGKRGCRVQPRAAREWSDTLTWRWQKMRNATQLAVRRHLRDELGFLGDAAVILLRVYEPQKRGVPHMHLVLGYATAAERAAAREFVAQLKRLASEYDFGFVDMTEPITAEDAARYLSSYLTGRNSKKKSSIRENIADPVMPRSLVWLTPALTSTSASERIAVMRSKIGVVRGTGVTMRWLRKARHLWAALEGRCMFPQFRDTEEAVRVVAVYMQAFRRGPPPALEPALGVAREIDAVAKRDGKWWLLEQQWREQLEFAFTAVAACMPQEVIA